MDKKMLHDSKPLYQVVKEKLIHYIEEKGLTTGAFFLSESEVCKKYKVSPITARRAVNDLTNEGVLVRKRGIGTFVGNHTLYSQITIGLILFDDESIFAERDYYTSELIRGISESAKLRQIKFRIFNITEEFDFVAIWKRAKVLKGLIIVAPSVKLQDELLKLKENKIPFVVVNAQFPKDTGIEFIDSNNVMGAYDAVKYLIQLGHKNILFVNDELNNSNAFDRLLGVKKAYAESNIPFNEKFLVSYSSEMENSMDKFAFKEVANRLRENKNITAAFFAGFFFLLGGVQALKKLKKKIPADFSIISFDDFPELMLHTPAISTIYQPISEIGKMAVQKLFDEIYNKDHRIVQTILECQLIIRESCKKIN